MALHRRLPGVVKSDDVWVLQTLKHLHLLTETLPLCLGQLTGLQREEKKHHTCMSVFTATGYIGYQHVSHMDMNHDKLVNSLFVKPFNARWHLCYVLERGLYDCFFASVYRLTLLMMMTELCRPVITFISQQTVRLSEPHLCLLPFAVHSIFCMWLMSLCGKEHSFSTPAIKHKMLCLYLVKGETANNKQIRLI